jgi:hypothetical protein
MVGKRPSCFDDLDLAKIPCSWTGNRLRRRTRNRSCVYERTANFHLFQILKMSRLKEQLNLKKSALPWALGILIVIELALHLPGFWELPAVREARTGERVFEAAKDRSASPKILVFGSSRFQNAVIPEVIEQELGLAAGSVSNLAFSGATPQDVLHLYKTEHEYFSKAELLVYEVGEFQYNWSAIADEPAGNIRYRKLADLETRLKSPGLTNKMDYGLGYWIRTWDLRFVLRDMLSSAVRGNLAFTESRLVAESNGQVGVRSNGQADEYIATSPDQLNAFGYRNFEISDYQLDAMAELLDLARADGLSLVINTPPLNDGFNEIVERNYASFDELWRASVTEKSNISIASLELTSPECEDWKNCFADIGHVNQFGASDFSIALAKYLGVPAFWSKHTSLSYLSDSTPAPATTQEHKSTRAQEHKS